MDNTYREKIQAIAGSLVRNPSQVWAYLRTSPLWGRSPVDLELPWISFGAMRHLDHWLQPQHEIFEFGGGGSTLYFARRARSVLTMESDSGWHGKLNAILKQRGITNVRCEHSPITGDEFSQFAGDAFFNRVRQQLWDLILVDCYCGYSKTQYGLTRPFALELALQQLKPGGVIVLDDAWMFRELLGPRPGFRIVEYIGLGPCRYGVTSTAILEKQL